MDNGKEVTANAYSGQFKVLVQTMEQTFMKTFMQQIFQER